MELKMTEKQTVLTYFAALAESGTCDDWQSVSCEDIKTVMDEINRLERLVSKAPTFTELCSLLEKVILDGHKLKKQGPNWHLFAQDGEGVTSAHSIFGVMMNMHHLHRAKLET